MGYGPGKQRGRLDEVRGARALAAALLACLLAALLVAAPALATGANVAARGNGGIDTLPPGTDDPGKPPPSGKYVTVPTSGYGFVHPKSYSKRCGRSTPDTLDRAKEAARFYYDAVKKPLTFGDFGVNCPGHLSHLRGMDTDITTDALPRLSTRSSVRLAYGRVMAAAFFKAGACFEIYNDRRIRKEWPAGRVFAWPNHWNHFHVRWHSLSRFDGKKCNVEPRHPATQSANLAFSSQVLRAYYRHKPLPKPPPTSQQPQETTQGGGSGHSSGGGGIAP